MRNGLQHPLIRLSVLLGAMFAGSGCVDWIGSQSMLVIDHAVPAHVFGQDCDVEGKVLVNGVLDVTFETPYRTGIGLRLNLPATQNTQKVQQDNQRSPNYQNYGNVDSNTVVIQELMVSMMDADTAEAIPGLPKEGQERISPASGVIFNEQTNLNAEKTIFVNAVTSDESKVIRDGRLGAEIGPTVAKTVLVTMQLRGYTSGGGQLTSSKFTLPVEVCRGCLAPPEFFTNNGQCPAGTALTTTECVPVGQDERATCQ